MKGIILAAGYGTRFLPITKTIPKEMLPLGTRPAIDYVVEEYVRSGITDILIINSRRKKTLEDFYDREAELESVFEREGKQENLRKITPPEGVRFYFVRQRKMGGTGDAVLLARRRRVLPHLCLRPAGGAGEAQRLRLQRRAARYRGAAGLLPGAGPVRPPGPGPGTGVPGVPEVCHIGPGGVLDLNPTVSTGP